MLCGYLQAAKKMCIAGLFLLPWIWALAYFHFTEKAKDPSALGQQLKVWRTRAGFGSLFALIAVTGWVVYFQTSYKSMGLESLLVYNPEPEGSW